MGVTTGAGGTDVGGTAPAGTGGAPVRTRRPGTGGEVGAGVVGGGGGERLVPNRTGVAAATAAAASAAPAHPAPHASGSAVSSRRLIAACGARPWPRSRASTPETSGAAIEVPSSSA